MVILCCVYFETSVFVANSCFKLKKFQLTLDNIKWYTCFKRTNVWNNIVVRILSYYLIAVSKEIVFWTVWVRPHGNHLNESWQYLAHLIWNALKVTEWPINHQEINHACSSKVSGCKATNRDSMYSNLDLSLTINYFHCLFFCKVVYHFNIITIVSWWWFPSTLTISSIVPQHNINTIIKVEVRPVRVVDLAFCIAHVWITNDHGTRCIDIVAMSFEVSRCCWKPEAINLVAIRGF